MRSTRAVVVLGGTLDMDRNRISTPRARLSVVRPDTSVDGAAAATLEALEEMHHPTHRFTHPDHGSVDLRLLAREYDVWLSGREKPLKPESRRKYQDSLEMLFRSMERAGDPLRLDHLHPHAVNRYIGEQRRDGRAEDGIASRLAAIKTFSRSFVYKHLELSEKDLLEKVKNFTPPEKPMPIMNTQELEQLMDSFDPLSFEGVRDAAMTIMLIGTGMRRGELHRIQMGDYDPITTQITLHAKGARIRPVRLNERAHKLLKSYLRIRPRSASQAMWVSRSGDPLGRWGVESIFRRLKGRCGIQRFHPHLLRHTFGSFAIRNGADRAKLADMMGHQSWASSVRYTREERKLQAAAEMPKYAPL